ncbi:MAG: hypothetical protein L0312_07730 [Acidobacteria bacterium]|nr:hypothetical protein [Acidobacteriota bacterium]
MGIYWYDIDPRTATFTRHVISYNSMVGTGMQMNIIDIDKDGDVDLVVSGKSGLFLLENMRHFSKRTGEITGSLGGAQRPNLVGDPRIPNPTVEQWFNTGAFAQPTAFTFGNVPRMMPNLRAPGQNNWDLALQKWWYWQDRFRIQFRSEFFNAFNHPNFYAPNTTFGNPAFGRITNTFLPRDIQFGAKLYW